MKKIGIITLYYKNRNYGGLLQSYALVKFLEKNGYEAKQISFEKNLNQNKKTKTRRIIDLIEEIGLIGLIKKIYYKIKLKISFKLISKKYRKIIVEKIAKRNIKFEEFELCIPHTKVVTEKDIGEINNMFDTFICGSDQIWKPGVNCPEYFLKFVKKDKTKISYAASIGRSNLAKEDLKYIINSVKELDAISLREEEAVNEFKQQNINAALVLDPTLLLDKDDWSAFAEEYKIDGKYIFCYFLGTSKKQRKMIEEFAKKKALKIVTMPFMSKIPSKNDIKFGDEKLYEISPKQLVYVIKNAEYIFTDSFHISVFSGIFEKNFFVFEREEEKTMNGRIVNLLKLYNANGRLIKTIDNIDSIPMYQNIFENNQFIKMKEESIGFLNKYLR